MRLYLKNISYYLIILIAIFGIFSLYEPGNAEAISAGSSIDVSQVVTSDLNLNCDTSITLTPSFASNPSGLAPLSSPAKDDFDCTVKTNNPAGFTFSIKNKSWGSSGISLVHNSDSSFKFGNYQSSPTYSWTNPSSGNALLGFTVGATDYSPAAYDVATTFKNDESDCATGANTNNMNIMDGASCWRGLQDTSSIVVASSSDETSGDGELFRLRFQARANAMVLKAGDYTTELTVTVTN